MRPSRMSLALWITFLLLPFPGLAGDCQTHLAEAGGRLHADPLPLDLEEIRARTAGKVIVLVGPPAAGKGTQAAVLREKLGCAHVSAGDLLRDEVRRGTEWGKRIAPIMADGKLVPSEIVNAILAERLRQPDIARGVLLDGFPRSVSQLADLEAILKPLGKQIDFVFHLDVAEDEAVRRIAGRRVCPSCKATYHTSFHPPKKDGVCDDCGNPLVQRADDSEETIRKRFEVYRKETGPLLEILSKRDSYFRITGGATPERMTEKILERLAVRAGLSGHTRERTLELLIEHGGGQVEDGRSVTRPGVSLLAMTSGLDLLGPEDCQATFLLSGISAESALELVAREGTFAARFTSDKIPEAKLSLSVASAVTLTLSIADFHKFFNRRLGTKGRETETRALARALASKLHALYPEWILKADEYLETEGTVKHAGARKLDPIKLPRGAYLVGATKLADDARRIFAVLYPYDPDTAHSALFRASFALVGLSEAEARELGAKVRATGGSARGVDPLVVSLSAGQYQRLVDNYGSREPVPNYVKELEPTFTK